MTLNILSVTNARNLAAINVPLRNDQTGAFQGQPPAAVPVSQIPQMTYDDLAYPGIVKQVTNSATTLVGQY